MCLSVLGHASRVIAKLFMLPPSLDYGALPNTSLLLLLKTWERGTQNGKENETKMQLNLTKQEPKTAKVVTMKTTIRKR